MGSMSVVSMAKLGVYLSEPSDSGWYYTSRSRTTKNATAVPNRRWENTFRKMPFRTSSISSTMSFPVESRLRRRVKVDAIAMVSKGNLRVRVAYLMSLTASHEVCSVAIELQHICQHTAPFIPVCNRTIELKPASCVHTRRDVCSPNVRIDGEHPSLFVIADIIVQIGGFG